MGFKNASFHSRAGLILFYYFGKGASSLKTVRHFIDLPETNFGMNLASNLPLDILHQIFENVESSASELDPYEFDPDTINYTPRNPRFDSTKISVGMREFTQYRLVSQNWKLVADTFLFRTLHIHLPQYDQLKDLVLDSESTDWIIRDPCWMLVNMILKGGYASMIRRLHVEIYYYEYVVVQCDRSSLNLLSAYVQLLCDLILHSTRCLSLVLSLALYRKLEPLLPVSNQLVSLLLRIPQCCRNASVDLRMDVGLGVDATDYVQDTVGRRPTVGNGAGRELLSGVNLEMFFKKWILRKGFLNILTFLELDIDLDISPGILGSLHSLKGLALHRDRVELPSSYYDDFSAGIQSLDNLRELELDDVPLSSFPITLRSLKILFTDPWVMATTTFWRSMYRLQDLENLQISYYFEGSTDFPLIDNEGLNTTPPPYSKLHTLQISASAIPIQLSELVNDFCTSITKSSPCLKIIRLSDVPFSTRDLCSISTRCLRELTLFRAESDTIPWSILTALLNRNPRVNTLQLHLSLTPLTYGDIDSISRACPNLPVMYLFKSDMDETEWESVMDTDDVTELKWLYGESPMGQNNKIMRHVLEMGSGLPDEDVEFYVEIDKFRRLRDGDRILESEDELDEVE